MESNLNAQELVEKYSKFSDDQIKTEFQEILSIPNARTNIEALTRLSALLPIMEERGLKETETSQISQSRSASSQSTNSVNWGGVILGIVLIVGGIILSTATGSIFYGAVIVGIGILFKNLI